MPNTLSDVTTLPLSLGAAREDAASAELRQAHVLRLFDAHATGLRRYVQSCGLSPESADDIVQETFLALYRHMSRDGNAENLRGWLFRVGHRQAMKQRHRSQRMRRWQLSWPSRAALVFDAGADPETQVLDRERRRSARAVLAALPDRDRQCFYLRAEGLRYRQIAATLGVSLGAVAKSLARGASKLSHVLGE